MQVGDAKLRTSAVAKAHMDVAAEEVRSDVARISLSELNANANYRNVEWLRRTWTPGFRAFKRTFDISVGAAILVGSLPVIAILALLIRLDSPGPVLYSQNRIGRDGSVFRMYKLRTMRRDAEAHGTSYAAKDDPRVTRVGKILRKTRLDEVPQLWNVLRGEMAIIGPRPERPENEQMLEEGIPGFSLRTCVRPGLTGWAQVCAPYANTIEQSGRKLEFDIYYISHASIKLDMKIAWRTTLIMLRMAGQ